MPYQYQPYPAHRHGLNGALRVVTNADEDAQAQAEGFATHPSLVGKPKTHEDVGTSASRPDNADKPVQTKAAKATAKTKAEKTPPVAPTAPAATPLEQAIAETPVFDRAAAIARLHAANFDVDPETTDAELVEAIVELDK